MYKRGQLSKEEYNKQILQRLNPDNKKNKPRKGRPGDDDDGREKYRPLSSPDGKSPKKKGRPSEADAIIRPYIEAKRKTEESTRNKKFDCRAYKYLIDKANQKIGKKYMTLI